MKAVQLLIESGLPQEMRDYKRSYGKKGTDQLLADVARLHPEQYSDIVQHLSDVGRNAAYLQGETLTLNDMRPVVDKQKALAVLDKEIEQAERIPNPEERKKAKLKLWSAFADQMEKETTAAAKMSGNNLAAAVGSGARGNAFQLKAMLTTPALYTDYRDRVIPSLVRRSFGEGLRPTDYLSSVFGVRKGVIATKQSTAYTGDYGKQLAQVAAGQTVTKEDCGTANGLDYGMDDDSLFGRVLAKDAGGLKAGTVIDKTTFARLRQSKMKNVIVRSPMTCQAKEGLCAQCLGLLPGGHFAPLGYAAGMTAANAASEPLTQGALSCLVDGTEVRMFDGTVRPIETINPGEIVLGADLQGRTFPVKVTHKWDQGSQPAQRYSYKLGQTNQFVYLEATEAHPILCNKKVYGSWKSPNNAKIVKLNAGYPHKRLAAIFPTDAEVQGDHEPYATWLGIYLGDGIRNNGISGLRFSCADQLLIDDMNAQSLQLNLRCKKLGRSYDWSIGVVYDETNQDSATGRMLPGYRNPLKRRLEEWGLIGKYAHEKTLPKAVWSWDKASVGALVAGYLATDGCVYKNKDGHVHFSFSSTSKEMLLQFKELLAVRLCVYASPIHAGGKAGTGNRKHDLWSLSVTRLDQVKKLWACMVKVPGIKGIKTAQFLGAVAYNSQYHDPFYRAARVKIEELGARHCWDLTVDHPDHLFVLANGLIVSNTKHGGGGFQGGKRTFSGFPVINQLAQSPETFPDRAAVATIAGNVESIEPAPQGGNYITINGEQHYALPGYDVTVKPGDQVEAGDQLSDGIIDVADVMKYRGLGEARRYYVDRLTQAYSESGVGKPYKTNLEILARASLDHLRVDDPDGLGDALPDDLISYNRLSSDFSPDKSTVMTPVEKSHGKVLQVPTLHFTIGTKMTPKMTKRLQEAGVTHVAVSDVAPRFTPEMQRLRSGAHSGTDFLAKLHSSYLTSNLGKDAERSRDTNVESNSHFVPRLAIGEGFGKNIERTGKF